MTEIRKGQIVKVPQGIGKVVEIYQLLAHGIAGAELEAHITVELLKDRVLVVVNRHDFDKIKPVEAVYNGKDGSLIGYTIPGEGIIEEELKPQTWKDKMKADRDYLKLKGRGGPTGRFE